MLSKQKFSDLPLLALKFSKFLRSFLERRVRFPSNFAWFFSVMRHKSSVLFQINLYMFSTKGTHRSAYFQAFDCSHEKLTKFLLSFFKPRVSFSLNFAALLSVMTLGSIILLKFSIQLKHSMLWTKRTHQDTIIQTSECSSESSSNSSCHFWYHKITALYFLAQRDHQSESFRPLSSWVKTHEITHVMFETTSQFFFKPCITLQCH